MDTYTVIATPDAGGVYISQIQAASPLDAFLRWSDEMLQARTLPNLDVQQFQEDVAFEAEELGPVAIEGTEGVWCLALTDIWVHLVKTDLTPEPVLENAKQMSWEPALA